MKAKHRRSKRVPALNKVSVSFLLTGVFLVGAIFFPQQASAAELTMMSPQLNDNLVKMQELKSEAERREEKIAAIMPQVEEIRKEQEAVINAKKELEQATSELEKEVAVLKVKVAEKKEREAAAAREAARIAALRLVVISSYAPDSAGNTYALGNCTWYAKSRRPDLPNSLGNANTWYSRAAAQGFKTGREARTNAVGVSFGGYYGHVVYVEKWLGNGRIIISEMNVNGLYSMQTREASESEFVYIYERQ